jgi:hypothetical protein
MDALRAAYLAALTGVSLLRAELPDAGRFDPEFSTKIFTPLLSCLDPHPVTNEPNMRAAISSDDPGNSR